MNFLFSILFFLSPLFLLSQKDQLTDKLWCFEANFLDSLSKGEIIEVGLFFLDYDPIKFKRNGKFKRIDSPLNMCGNASRSKRIDLMKGRWSLNQDTLILHVKNKTVEFNIVHKTENQLILKVIGLAVYK